MMTIKPSPTTFPLLKTRRLHRLAELVPSCDAMIDVGTDHGWLPIALVQQGVARRAIASDVLRDPLEIATRHIRAHRLSEKISARRGDGLATLEPGEAEVITIAGMGIKSILAILSAKPPHTLGAHTLIVQTPQIDNAFRQIFTRDYPWSITHEEFLYESPQIYHMLVVDLTTATPEPVTFEGLDALVSPYLQANQDSATMLHALQWLIHRKRLRLDGLLRAVKSPRHDLIEVTRAELDLLTDYQRALQARHSSGS